MKVIGQISHDTVDHSHLQLGTTATTALAGNTAYGISCVDGANSDEENIRLTKSFAGTSLSSVTDDIVLEAGTGLSIARSGDKITFTNTVTDTDTVLTTEQVQDIVGGMVSGNTETNIAVTYDDAGGKLNFASTDTNTQLTLIDSDSMTGALSTNVASAESVKAYVDSKFSYQYLTFSFKLNLTSDCWTSPSQNGIHAHDWNNTHGSGGSQAASHAPSAVTAGSTIEIDVYDKASAFVIPDSCTLIGFYGNCRLNSTSPQTLAPVVGLFRMSEPADLHNVDANATAVAYHKYNGTTGSNMKNRFLKMASTGWSVSLTAGDLLYPAVGADASGTGVMWGAFTVILRKSI